MTTTLRRLALGAIVALSGCAASDLKAPCSRDEGLPAAYAEPLREPEPFASFDACGAMKPINAARPEALAPTVATQGGADGDLRFRQ